MNEFQTLDKPEDKRLFGLDLHINSYHIINPDQDELLIIKKKKFDLGVFWAAVVFGAIASFPGYFAVKYMLEGEPFSEWSVPFIIALFLLIISLSTIYGLVINKMQCHFTATELILTSHFGRKKFISRADVISVFITQQIRTTNGKETGFNYSVDLKVPFKKYKNGQLELLQIQEKNSMTSIIGGINANSFYLAKQDAMQIAKVIAEHWKIPLSV